MAMILQNGLKAGRHKYYNFLANYLADVKHTSPVVMNFKASYSSSCKLYSKLYLVENHPQNKNDQSNNNNDKETRRRSFAIMVGSLVGAISFSYIFYQKNYAKAKSEEVKEENDANVSKDSKELVVKSGFKERKIIEYENRIRQYSTPDKIFRYFATLQDASSGDIFMTPEDFVRSLTPNALQPHGLGLDQFKQVDVKNLPAYESEHFGKSSVFLFIGDKGLINFSDYVFLVAVLGTSTRHINLAFRMFDLNGDGEVTVEEFHKVRSLFLNMSTSGSRHRDRKTTGSVLHDSVSSGLTAYFFGVDGLKKLTVEEFVAFKMKLQQEVMLLEFHIFGSKDGVISEHQFTEMLLTYAYFDNAKHSKILKRIKNLYGEGTGKNEGLLFQDYLDFFQFLLNLRDVEMALSFHTVAGETINKETFKQVAKLVAGVELRDHLIDVVFSIFDENEDNHLSNKEFVAVMKDKIFRGLNKPKDTGFTRFLSAILKCAKTSIGDSLVRE